MMGGRRCYDDQCDFVCVFSKGQGMLFAISKALNGKKLK